MGFTAQFDVEYGGRTGLLNTEALVIGPLMASITWSSMLTSSVESSWAWHWQYSPNGTDWSSNSSSSSAVVLSLWACS